MFNFKSNRSFFFSLLLVVLLTLGLSISLQQILAQATYFGPIAPPPGGNKDAPINVGSDTQSKAGRLQVGDILTASATAMVLNAFSVIAGPGANDGFYVNQFGNVGIGTINPGYKLDVNGSLSADTIRLKTNAAQGRILMSDNNGNASWVSTSSLGLGSGGWGGGASYVLCYGTTPMPAGCDRLIPGYPSAVGDFTCDPGYYVTAEHQSYNGTSYFIDRVTCKQGGGGGIYRTPGVKDGISCSTKCGGKSKCIMTDAVDNFTIPPFCDWANSDYTTACVCTN